MAERPAYIEIKRFGAAVKVTAVDSETLIEISLQAPASTPQAMLCQLALAKLSRALERGGPVPRIRH
jgi:hypothetical protein